MKHIKDFNSHNALNEGVITWIIASWLFYKFMKGLLTSIFQKKIVNKVNNMVKDSILTIIKNTEVVPVMELNDRYFIKLNTKDVRNSEDVTLDIRIMKDEKVLKIEKGNANLSYKLSDAEYDNFLKILKINN